VPRYGKSLADSPSAILTPGGAGWEPSETVDLDFALLAAMPGMFGFSGDLSGLSKEQGSRIAEGVAFYKTWRRFITGAVAHLLTPPEILACREGWVGVQLQAPGGDTSLVFVYRLGPCGAPPPLRLCGLKPEVRYVITRGFDPSVAPASGIGADLMRDGLRVDGPGAFAQAGSRAEVFCVAPAEQIMY
jgi:hypothetical protein